MKIGYTISLISLVVIAVSCNKDGITPASQEITKINYKYYGSSLPPQYHRSFNIEIEPDKISMTVDSYGRVLAESSHPLTNEQYLRILNSLYENGIKTRRSNKDENSGCTGGHEVAIMVAGPAGEIFSGSNYYCGGKIYGDLDGNTDAFLEELKKYIPNFSHLINTPHPDYLE